MEIFVSGCNDRIKGEAVELKIISVEEPELKHMTTGVILSEIKQDTTFIEDHCPAQLGDIVTEGMIEPLIKIELDGVQPIEVIKETEIKQDTNFLVGEIREEDIIKKISPVISKADSTKKIKYPGNCDSLPKNSIEP